MNRNLNNITLRRGYTGIILSKSSKLSRNVELLINGKVRNVLYTDWQHFFLKETLLVYPTLTNFIQRKRKMYDTNDLLALSLLRLHFFISISAHALALKVAYIFKFSGLKVV